MAQANTCKFIAGSSGTSDFADGTALTGFRNLAGAGLSNGVEYSYRAQSADLSQWENGRGTYDSGDGVLERTEVYESSNSGSAVDFTAAPIVYLTPLKSDFEDIASALAAKAALESPAFTGNPTAPTQDQSDDSTKIATTGYVRAAISAILNGVSSAYDTLQEIAAALVSHVGNTSNPHSVTASQVGALALGKHTIQFLPGAFIDPDSGGPEFLKVTATNMLPAWGFDTSADEELWFAFRAPKSSNESAGFTFDYVWSHPATTTNFGVAMFLQLVAVGNSDLISTSMGTAVELDDTGGTTNDIFISGESGTVTPGGSWAEGDLIIGRLYRDVSDSFDNMAVDMRLHALNLYVTINAGNDA